MPRGRGGPAGAEAHAQTEDAAHEATRFLLGAYAPAAVTGAGVLKADELQAIDHEVLALIERAVTEAKAAPQPTVADLLTDVYVKY